MNTGVIAECMRLSFADTPFPAVVAKLAEAGVEAYAADLIALRETCYGAGNDSVDEPMPLTDVPAIARLFDGNRVAATVAAIQRGEIGYAQFLRRIMRAGCAGYSVFFGGRKVMYFGRQGDVHTEYFPDAGR
jgi:uncharacterized protein YbcV (DUF1398 family)